MRDYLTRSLLTAICVLLIVGISAKAQSGDVGLSISVNPTTTSPGSTVGVFSFVTNNTNNKLRTIVTVTSASPCGTQTNIGYNRLTLEPGQTVQVTVSYPVASNACAGNYAISINASSGAKNSPVTSATTYLLVQ